MSTAPAAPIVISSNRPHGLLARINPSYLPLLTTLLVMIALIVAGGIAYPNFARIKPMNDLFGDNSYLGIAAIGATVVILSGGIDLSIGAVVAFSTILMARLIYPTAAQPAAAGLTGDGPGYGLHPLLAAAITLAAGSLFGLLMGALIAFYEAPPFMITLAGMFFMRAVSFMVYPTTLEISHPFYVDTLAHFRWHIADMAGRRHPIAVYMEPTAMLMLLMFAIAIIVMHLTPLGRNVYAIGGDENAARLLGVPVRRTKISVYAISGFCAALAGAVMTIYKRSGDPAGFVGLELDAIAATVIGGTLLAGGRGFVVGTLLGVLVLGVIQTLINFNGNLRPEWTRIFIGVLMFLFIILQSGFGSLGRLLGRRR
jgi:ribose/xylose/arabinose/galactoside ABC-type transport system permease subunit